MRRVYFVFLPLIVLFFSAAPVSSQDANKADAGRKLFVESRCYTCHTINAESKAIHEAKVVFAKSKGVELKSDDEEEEGIGPDLSDIGTTTDAVSLTKYLKNPKPYFKSTSECKRKAKKKYRKRFKGTKGELGVLVGYLTGLKYESRRAADFVSCLKED